MSYDLRRLRHLAADVSTDRTGVLAAAGLAVLAVAAAGRTIAPGGAAGDSAVTPGVWVILGFVAAIQGGRLLNPIPALRAGPLWEATFNGSALWLWHWLRTALLGALPITAICCVAWLFGWSPSAWDGLVAMAVCLGLAVAGGMNVWGPQRSNFPQSRAVVSRRTEAHQARWMLLTRLDLQRRFGGVPLAALVVALILLAVSINLLPAEQTSGLTDLISAGAFFVGCMVAFGFDHGVVRLLMRDGGRPSRIAGDLFLARLAVAAVAAVVLFFLIGGAALAACALAAGVRGLEFLHACSRSQAVARLFSQIDMLIAGVFAVLTGPVVALVWLGFRSFLLMRRLSSRSSLP